MVEFILLFALGFLSALLLGLFIAPAIHTRIVKFTERRLRATVPMSAAELKAGRDMARAAYAVENQRVAMELKAERQKRIDILRKVENLQTTGARMRGEIADLTQRIDTMSVEAGDMRSTIRQREQQTDTMKLALSDAERSVAEREHRIKEMEQGMRRLSIDIEDMKIDVATRDTEVESLKVALETITEERRRLRDDFKAAQVKAKDFEYRFGREEGRHAALEKKLGDAVARLTDQESMVERRNAEVKRLKEKLKAATANVRTAEQRLKAAEEERRTLQAALAKGDKPAAVNGRGKSGNGDGGGHGVDGEAAAMASQQAPGGIDRAAISQRVERLRARHTALVDTLTAADGDGDDQALRREIKEIAASMISLTAAREGKASPIHAIIAGGRGDAKGGVWGDGRDVSFSETSDPSLGARAAMMMRED